MPDHALSCATCWPRACGEPPSRALCRRRSEDKPFHALRHPCCLHCTHVTAHHPDAWHARPCERCQA